VIATGQPGGDIRQREESLKERIALLLGSQTPSLLPWVDELALTAVHNVSVFLTGETGTGKSHLARLIHDCSPRQNHRLVTVPCGALAPHLIESELFGHVRGAFTGADCSRVGKFQAAGPGTIFLDEIDILGLDHQAALLRVIETGEYEPVGSNETRMSQARLIVASNRNLEQMAMSGSFRQDLYYRLNIVSFHLQPLRRRTQDIVPLARALLARFAADFGKEVGGISPSALAALEQCPWPGNIRQLENVLQQAVLVCKGPKLQLEDLHSSARGEQPPPSAVEYDPSNSLWHKRDLVEHDTIRRALKKSGYHYGNAARLLGVSRVTLYKKMKKHGLGAEQLLTPPER